MSDTLKRLAGPANLANGSSTVFTGSAGHTYTVRNINLANTTGSGITVKIGINGIADANLILPSTSIAANTRLTITELFVLSGAETIQANVSATGVTATVSGLDQI